MPFNPQSKKCVNLCSQILANFVKQEEVDSLEQGDSAQFQQNPEFAQGKWEDQQNLKFTVFIDYHSKIFASKQRRKNQKIFKILSTFLGNRTPAQCRSHYQKLMIKFKSMAKMRRHFKQYFKEQIYSKEYQMFAQNWKKATETEQKCECTKKQFTQVAIQTDPISDVDGQYMHMFAFWQMQQYMNMFYYQNQESFNQPISN